LFWILSFRRLSTPNPANSTSIPFENSKTAIVLRDFSDLNIFLNLIFSFLESVWNLIKRGGKLSDGYEK